MPRKKKTELPEVFAICRYEQWFELPESSGYCTQGPLKFFRFFVSGTDPSAREFLERIDRLCRYGDEHHLLGVYTKLVTYASLQPKCRRGYLLDVDDDRKPMSIDDLAWKLGMDEDDVANDLVALTKCRLVERVAVPVEWANDGGGASSGPAKSKAGKSTRGDSGGMSGTSRSKPRKAANVEDCPEFCGTPHDPAESCGTPGKPVIYKLKPEPERITEEPERKIKTGTGSGPLRVQEQKPEDQVEPEVVNAIQGEPEAYGEPVAQGDDVTGEGMPNGPPANAEAARFNPQGSAIRGRATPIGSGPPGGDIGTRAREFACQVFRACGCPYDPLSALGLSELGNFREAWLQAERMHAGDDLDALWWWMLDTERGQAAVVARLRKNPKKKWTKSPEAFLRWKFGEHMHGRLGSGRTRKAVRG